MSASRHLRGDGMFLCLYIIFYQTITQDDVLHEVRKLILAIMSFEITCFSIGFTFV